MRHSSSHLYEPALLDERLPESQAKLPLIFDREGVRAVDRLAINEFGIPGIVLMENAARGAVDVALQMLAQTKTGSVVIVCGGGNNGGDGLAIAHLHNRGFQVLIVMLAESSRGSDADIQLQIVRKMRLPELPAAELDEYLSTQHVSMIVDAIFGSGLDRPIVGHIAEVIGTINRVKRPVLSIDIPSGLDCDTGEILGCCIQASRTLTFVGLKKGFLGLDAQNVLGEVTVADIGAPIELLERFGHRIQPKHPEAPEHDFSTGDRSPTGNERLG